MSEQKTIFVSGNFNILHPGHQRLLIFAKSLGNKLVVGVISDYLAGDSAYINEDLRLESLRNNSLVDQAFIIKDSIETTLLDLKPDIVVKGKEYQEKENIEVRILETYGGSITFSAGESVFTSSELIKNEILSYSKIILKNEESYLKRHNISKDQLSKTLNNFKKINVLVIGETIVDEYISCQPIGMSHEDPTIVVNPLEKKLYLGGAAIVASHAASLGANAKFLTVTGDDNLSLFVKKELKKNNVGAKLFIDKTRPTSLKQRYRANGKSLFRVNNIHQNSISNNIQNSIFKELKKNISQIDLIVLSDFNYGVITNSLLKKIIKLVQNRDILIVADSQSSSQTGDISRFKNMNLITPTEREARISMRDNQSGIIGLINDLQKITESKNIILKMGADGILINSNNNNNNNKDSFLTDKIGPLNMNPVDVSGAGDSMLIASSMSLASKNSIWISSYIGSLAAAIQISRVGNVPIQFDEIIDLI